MADFQDWSREVAGEMERTLSDLLPAANSAPQRLHDAMRYATLGGGKRVRPMLTFAAGLVTDAEPARLKIVAAAVEIIHAYSLIHDDLPCMDDDVLRRGRPPRPLGFYETTALLCGGAPAGLGFSLVSAAKMCAK